MAEPDNWTVVASAIPKRRVSTAEILRMVADGWHLTPGTVAYQKSVDQLRARADELDAATVEAAEPDPSAPVPIPLPAEPPRDRVIEAVDQDGTVMEQWAWDGQYWVEAEVGCWAPWWSVVAGAMRQEWFLRHVAAEEAS